MPKQVIVIMEENYPFGECEQCTNENTRVLVRKIYQVNIQQRNKLLDKVNVLRKLKNQHMIKIQSVLEEEESIHFLFEYIPIKLQTWISNINDQFIENFRDQLIKFSSFLANNFIKIDFQLKNIGMDQNYGAKYFLDLSFEVDSGINRQKLKSTYIREITNLFKPYIMNASASTAYPLDSERERYSNDFKNSKEAKNNQDTRKVHDTSISPPTNKGSNNAANNKNKEKALAQYYQEVNMSVDSENEKILQQFMDVLDNEEEQQIKTHQHQPPPPKPQQNTSQTNQFQKQQVQQSPPQQAQKNSYQNSPQQHNNSYQQNTSYQQSSPYQQQNTSYQQNNSFQQGNYPQYQYNQFSSAQQLPSNPQVNQHQQFHTQNNLNNYQNPGNQNLQVKTVNSSQSMGRGKSELKQSPQGEKWRQSADLQNRVKNAIQKSMNVIKKFKAIKDDSMM